MTLMDTRVDDTYPTRITGTPAHLPRVHPTVWDTEADGPIDAATLANHETKGYTVVEDLLSVGEVQTYWQELVRLSSDEELTRDERVITEAKTGEVRSIFDVHEISRPDRRAGARPARAGPGPAAARLRGVHPPEPRQLHARVQGHRVLLALGLRNLARGGRHAGPARGQLLHRADGQLPVQRRPDDHAGLAPDVRPVRRRDAGRQLQGVAQGPAGGRAERGRHHEDGGRARHRPVHRPGRLGRCGSTRTSCTAPATTSPRTRARTSSWCSTAWRTLCRSRSRRAPRGPRSSPAAIRRRSRGSRTAR